MTLLINEQKLDGQITIVPGETIYVHGRQKSIDSYEASIRKNGRRLTKRFASYDDCLKFLKRHQEQKND